MEEVDISSIFFERWKTIFTSIRLVDGREKKCSMLSPLVSLTLVIQNTRLAYLFMPINFRKEDYSKALALFVSSLADYNQNVHPPLSLGIYPCRCGLFICKVKNYNPSWDLDHCPTLGSLLGYLAPGDTGGRYSVSFDLFFPEFEEKVQILTYMADSLLPLAGDDALWRQGLFLAFRVGQLFKRPLRLTLSLNWKGDTTGFKRTLVNFDTWTEDNKRELDLWFSRLTRWL